MDAHVFCPETPEEGQQGQPLRTPQTFWRGTSTIEPIFPVVLHRQMTSAPPGTFEHSRGRTRFEHKRSLSCRPSRPAGILAAAHHPLYAGVLSSPSSFQNPRPERCTTKGSRRKKIRRAIRKQKERIQRIKKIKVMHSGRTSHSVISWRINDFLSQRVDSQTTR